MSRPILPPRGAFIATALLFDRRLSATMKETLFYLIALTWGRDDHTTPRLSWSMLENITGKNARTLRGHIAALRTSYAALRLQYADSGHFFITLADELFPSVKDNETGPGVQKNVPMDGELLPSPVKEEEDLSLTPLTGFNPPPHPDHSCSLKHSKKLPAGRQKTASTNPRLQKSAASGQISHAAAHARADRPAQGDSARKGERPSRAKRARASQLDPQVVERMLEQGVFPALLDEIERIARSAGYASGDLLALLDWCADEKPESPAALFIGRLRAGGRAPAKYSAPACPRCGQRGRHEKGCVYRYMEG